ncbi:MAG: (2Fe-2S)-binding protein [Anaerolineae bacterium]
MPTLKMILNGQEVFVDVEAGDLLADVLRDRLGLIGTKISCGEGECGACTVLVDGKAVDSCLYPALKVQGREVVTIEGLGEDNRLDPIQQAFVDKTAPQCGYCIPGMVISAKALLDENPHPTRKEIEEGISGNLCRCTGYYQIIEAIELAAERLAEKGGPK